MSTSNKDSEASPLLSDRYELEEGRVFLTGISPVVLSDITSGYNVAEDLSQRPRFHDLCGFTEAELRVTLEAVAVAHSLDAAQVDTALTLMRDLPTMRSRRSVSQALRLCLPAGTKSLP